MSEGMFTFEIWDAAGNTGSITIPAPAHWYHRWPLRFAAFLWRVIAEVEMGKRGIG